MTVEKINIKGNWMIKTLLGFVFAFFASFGFLISSNGRVAAQELGDCHMPNGDVLESISYDDCAGAGGIWLSGAGSDGASGGFEKYEETGFGSISFNYGARVEESWSKDVNLHAWTEYFSGSYVYYISGSASVYLEKKALFFGAPRHIALYKEGKETYEKADAVRYYENNKKRDSSINFTDSDLGEGVYYFMYLNEHDTSNKKMYKLIVDLNNPTVRLNLDAATSYVKSRNIIVTVKDSVKLDHDSFKYKWSTSSAFSSTGMTSSALTRSSDTEGRKTVSSPSSATGIYYLHIEAKDFVGNRKTYTGGPYYLDNTDPTIAFLSDLDPTDSVYRKAKTVTIIANDTSSLDHASLKYKWSTSSTFSSTGMTYSALTQISDTWGERSVTSPSGSSGVYYLHVQIKDKAGNIKNEVTGPFLLDNTAPTPGKVTFRDLNGDTFDPNRTNAWSAVDIIVGMKAASDNSGRLQTDKIIVEMTNEDGIKDQWDHTPGELLLQSSGFYKLTHIVIDEAGNKATEKVYNFTIDKIVLESSRVELKSDTEEKILEDEETYYTNKNVILSPNKLSSELSGLGTVKVYFYIHKFVTLSDGYIAYDRYYNSDLHGLQPVSVSEEGKYEIIIITSNGRHLHGFTHYLVIDKTAPPNNSTLSFTEENNDIYDAGVDATWTSSSVLVSVANVGVDDGSDPAAISGETKASYTVKYLDNNGNWQIYENIINSTIDKILSTTNSYLIEVYTTDRAGNVTTRTYRVKIDKENPVGDMLFSRTDNTPVDLTTSAWINHDLNLNIEKMQTKYIEEPTEYSFNIKREGIEIANSVIGYTLRGDGQYEIVLNMNKPQSGNSATKTYTFYIDKTNPSYAGEIKLMRESGDEIEDGSWVNIEDGLKAAINKNGEDAMAFGKTVLSYYNAALEKYTEYNGEVFNTSGRYTFKITTYDKAGNFTTGEKTVTLFNSNELGLDDVLIEFNYDEYDKDSKPGLYNGFTYIDGNGYEYNYKTGDNNPNKPTIKITIRSKTNFNEIYIGETEEDALPGSTPRAEEFRDIGNGKYRYLAEITFEISKEFGKKDIYFTFKTGEEYKSVPNPKTLVYDNIIKITKDDGKGTTEFYKEHEMNVSFDNSIGELSTMRVDYVWADSTNPNNINENRFTDLFNSGEFVTKTVRTPSNEITSENYRLYVRLKFGGMTHFIASESVYKIDNYVEKFEFKIAGTSNSNKSKEITYKTLTNSAFIEAKIKYGDPSGIFSIKRDDISLSMDNDYQNTHIDKIYENGTYVYTITDTVGNTFTTTVKIESFDRNAPDLYIEDVDNQAIKIGEDYIHQYKPVGCDGPCWVSDFNFKIIAEDLNPGLQVVYVWVRNNSETVAQYSYNDIVTSNRNERGVYNVNEDNKTLYVSTVPNGQSWITVPAGSGTYDLYVGAKDTAGNTIVKVISTIKIDRVKPNAPKYNIGENGITITATDGGTPKNSSGIKEISYQFVNTKAKINNENWITKKAEPDTTINELLITEYPAGLVGEFNLYLRSADYSGRVTAPVRAERKDGTIEVFRIDTIAPTIDFADTDWINVDNGVSISINDESYSDITNELNIYYLVSDVNLESTATQNYIKDNGDYLKHKEVSATNLVIDKVLLNDFGTVYIYVLVVDAAGNATSVETKAYHVDRKNPNITVNVDGEPIEGPIKTNDKVTIELDLSDDGSGLSTLSVYESPYTSPKEVIDVTGNYIYTIEKSGKYILIVTDNVGRTSQREVEVIIVNEGIDFEYSLELSSGSSYHTNRVYNENVTVKVAGFIFINEHVGLTGVYYKNGEGEKIEATRDTELFQYTFEINENGTYTIITIDEVGNRIEKTFTVTNFDKEAPIISTGDIFETPETGITYLYNDKSEQISFKLIPGVVQENHINDGTGLYLRMNLLDKDTREPIIIKNGFNEEIQEIQIMFRLDLNPSTYRNEEYNFNLLKFREYISDFSGYILFDFVDAAGNAIDVEHGNYDESKLLFKVEYTNKPFEIEINIDDVVNSVVSTKDQITVGISASDSQYEAALLEAVKNGKVKYYLLNNKYYDNNGTIMERTLESFLDGKDVDDVITEYFTKTWGYIEGTNQVGPEIINFTESGQYELWIAVTDKLGNSAIYAYDTVVINVDMDAPEITKYSYSIRQEEIEGETKHVLSFSINEITDRNIFYKRSDENGLEAVENQLELILCLEVTMDGSSCAEESYGIEWDYQDGVYTARWEYETLPDGQYFTVKVTDELDNTSSLEPYMPIEDGAKTTTNIFKFGPRVNFRIDNFSPGFETTGIQMKIGIFRYGDKTGADANFYRSSGYRCQGGDMNVIDCYIDIISNSDSLDGYLTYNYNNGNANLSVSYLGQQVNLLRPDVTIYLYIVNNGEIYYRKDTEGRETLPSYNFVGSNSVPSVSIETPNGDDTISSTTKIEENRLKVIIEDRLLTNDLNGKPIFDYRLTRLGSLVKSGRMTFDIVYSILGHSVISKDHYIYVDNEYIKVGEELIGEPLDTSVRSYYYYNEDTDEYLEDDGTLILPFHYMDDGEGYKLVKTLYPGLIGTKKLKGENYYVIGANDEHLPSNVDYRYVGYLPLTNNVGAPLASDKYIFSITAKNFAGEENNYQKEITINNRTSEVSIKETNGSDMNVTVANNAVINVNKSIRLEFSKKTNAIFNQTMKITIVNLNTEEEEICTFNKTDNTIEGCTKQYGLNESPVGFAIGNNDYFYYYLDSGSYKVTAQDIYGNEMSFDIHLDFAPPRIELGSYTVIGDAIIKEAIPASGTREYNLQELESLYFVVTEENLASVTISTCIYIGDSCGSGNSRSIVYGSGNFGSIRNHTGNVYSKVRDGLMKGDRDYYYINEYDQMVPDERGYENTLDNYIVENFDGANNKYFIKLVLDGVNNRPLSTFADINDNVQITLTAEDSAKNKTNVSVKLKNNAPIIETKQNFVQQEYGDENKNIIDIIINNLVVTDKGTILVLTSDDLVQVDTPSLSSLGYRSKLVYYTDYDFYNTGVYEVKAVYYDAVGNETFYEVSFKINVKDTIKPTIEGRPELLQEMVDSDVEIKKHIYNGPYVVDLDEFGIVDKSDVSIILMLSDIDRNFEWNSNIGEFDNEFVTITAIGNRYSFNFKVMGRYEFTYTITDISGNQTEEIVRFTIADIEPLVINYDELDYDLVTCPVDGFGIQECYKITVPTALDVDIDKYVSLTLFEEGIRRNGQPITLADYNIIRRGFVKTYDTLETGGYYIKRTDGSYYLSMPGGESTNSDKYIIDNVLNPNDTDRYSEYIIQFKKTGNYELKLVGQDSNNNPSIVPLSITVTDTTAPMVENVTIKIAGETIELQKVAENKYSITLQLGTLYEEIRINWIDDFDGVGYKKVTQTQIFDQIRTYILEETIQDQMGNSIEVTIEILIEDSEAPNLDNIVLEYLDDYELGTLTKDNVRFEVKGITDNSNMFMIEYRLSEDDQWMNCNNAICVIGERETPVTIIYFRVVDYSNNEAFTSVTTNIVIDNKAPSMIGLDKGVNVYEGVTLIIEDMNLDKAVIYDNTSEIGMVTASEGSKRLHLEFGLDANNYPDDGIYKVVAFDKLGNSSTVYFVINTNKSINTGSGDETVLSDHSMTKVDEIKQDGSYTYTIPETLTYTSNDYIRIYTIDSLGNYKELNRIDASNIPLNRTINGVLLPNEHLTELGEGEFYIYLGVTPKSGIVEPDPVDPIEDGAGSALTWVLYSVGGLAVLFAGLQIVRARKKVRAA